MRLWEQGKKGIYFSGTVEQRPNFEVKRGTKTILGNRKHNKGYLRFWGTGEQANLFQENKGTGTPPPWDGLIFQLTELQIICKYKR